MAKSPAHPVKDTTTVPRSGSLDTWIYLFAGLTGVGFLDTLGAPQGVRVLHILGLWGLSPWYLLG